MKLRHAVAEAIKVARKLHGLSQEDFSVISSRTYVSSLERSKKSPTVDKLEQLCQVMHISPASILLAAEIISSKPSSHTDVWEEILRKSNLIVDEYMSKR